MADDGKSPTIWTQHVEVRWPTSLAFFENRYAVLRALDDAHLLRHFRHSEARIDVRLGDSEHLLSFGAIGMTLSALKPRADLERLDAAARIVLTSLEPSQMTKGRAILQWIESSGGQSYDLARSAAAANTFGSAPSGEYLDYAAIIDGRLEQPAATYHLEAGVADSGELPARFNRAMVRLRGPGEGGNLDAPPTMWPRESLPEFALFCNSEWTLGVDLAPSWDDASAVFAAVRNVSGEIVDSVFERLDTQSQQESP